MAVPFWGRSYVALCPPQVTWNFRREELVAEAATYPSEVAEVSTKASLLPLAAFLWKDAPAMDVAGVKLAPLASSELPHPERALKQASSQTVTITAMNRGALSSK